MSSPDTPERADRPYDIVLFGASGFTGALTAAYLAEHAPVGLRWALAGRNRTKLEGVRAALPPSAADLELVEADVTDAASMRRVAESARVVITTVGPYIRIGEPLVAACAEAGTDYLDLTGEPEFVDLMWLRHGARAAETGARLVHACGFDSIPHDLGAQFTVEQLPEGVPLTVRGYVRAGGTFSGGTFDSAVTAMSRMRGAVATARQRREVEPGPTGRRVHAETGRPGYDRAAGGWRLPMPTIDPQVVLRSAAALERYGPDFTYGHYLLTRSPVTAAGIAAGVGGLFAMAQLKPTRDLLLRVRPSGAGPSEEQRAKAWFTVRFLGEGGGRQVTTEVSGGDPGYGETSKMLAESALCLALDDLPHTAGQVTSAVAMGPALRERLVAAGIAFRVLSTTS